MSTVRAFKKHAFLTARNPTHSALRCCENVSFIFCQWENKVKFDKNALENDSYVSTATITTTISL